MLNEHYCCCAILMQAKRLIAVAVLDATVKVFHEDTLKFFLSLYGHKVHTEISPNSLSSVLLLSCTEL
jgi:U3 small nucleolar RNA-associated protein 12